MGARKGVVFLNNVSNTTQNNCDLRYRPTHPLSLVRFHVGWGSGLPSPCFQRYKFYTHCCILICSDAKLLQLCPTLCDPMDCSLPGSSVRGDSLGKNTRMGCHDLLQGIFPTQGLNPHPYVFWLSSLPPAPTGKLYQAVTHSKLISGRFCIRGTVNHKTNRQNL